MPTMQCQTRCCRTLNPGRFLQRGTMAELGICDQCKDRNNPVTAKNGGTLSRATETGKQWIADVHKDCKAEWLKKNGAADYAGLEPK